MIKLCSVSIKRKAVEVLITICAKQINCAKKLDQLFYTCRFAPKPNKIRTKNNRHQKSQFSNCQSKSGNEP